MKPYIVALSLILSAFSLFSCTEDEPESNEPDTEQPGTDGPDIDRPGGETDPDEGGYDNLVTIITGASDLSYGQDGIWTGNTQPGFVKLDGYEFSHLYQDMQGYDYISGFTPSKINDTSLHSPLYSFPYAAMAGGGVEGIGTPYLVAFWDNMEADSFGNRSCRIFAAAGETFVPQSVMVCVNSYVYYTLLNGSDFSKKFGLGDYLVLEAHGVHPDGKESLGEFYLANIINPDDVASGIVTEWTEFDLSGLGICTGVYFTMRSSDSGQYGMNTPAYFCLDKLILKD